MNFFSSQAKPWHFVVVGLAFVLLCVGLWCLNTQQRLPVIKEDIPRGANADNALKINMDGG